MNLAEIAEKIELYERKIKKAEEEKIKAEENLKFFKQRQEEIETKMKEHNVTPDTIGLEIEVLEKNIDSLMKEIEISMSEII